ncbi:TVP38/TMEM64 family protein [Paenibacillus swuensis]|uniref:TVP38/TMEM64 family protein n=1 Tax=Paenibacillus swuensis TaxID=1178515 RepID=UPI0008393A1C|nr:VTT domain-containing protein [Paenibacillus swuensis]
MRTTSMKFPTVLIVMSVVSLALFAYGLPTMHPIYRTIGLTFTGLLLLAGVLSYVTGRLRMLRLVRLTGHYYYAAIGIVTVIYYLTSILVITDAYGMEALFRDHLPLAKWIYFLLCVAQPIILPLPELVTVVAASTVFGPLPAFIIGFIGTYIGILIMFTAARIGGLKLIHKLIELKKLERYHRYVAKNELLIMTLLFIIPVLPDEIICVGAGVSGVSPKRFMAVAAVSKLVTSFVLSYIVA